VSGDGEKPGGEADPAAPSADTSAEPVETADRPSTRPLLDDLADVSEDEHVYRFVAWSAWRDNPPDGKSFLLKGFVQTKEFGPHDDSYGPSVWVESTLASQGGIAALESIDPKLVHKGIVRVPVREVVKCKIKVKSSPADTDPIYARHADAHASFVGLDDDKRDELLDRCQHYIFRPPPNGGKKPGT
jgi:hypothetical protein